MMNLKKTALIIAGAALLATGAVVADPHGNGDRHRGHGMSDGMPMMMVGRLVQRLELDETQEAQIENILEAAKPEFEVIRDRGRTTRAAMLNLDPASPDYSAELNNLALESGQLVTDTALLAGRVRAEVNAVLTAEQAAELKDIVSRFGERMGERRQGRGERRRNAE